MTGGETLAIWNLASNSGPNLLRVPKAATANIALSGEGQQIALNVTGGVATVGLDDSNQRLLKLPSENDSSATDVLAFSPNQESTARTGLVGKSKPRTIWNTTFGDVTLSLNDVVGFAWLTDSHQFVSGDQEGRVQIRIAKTGG